MLNFLFHFKHSFEKLQILKSVIFFPAKFKTNFILKAKTIKKKNEIYWDVTSITLKIHDVSNFKVNFENLFNGDKALGMYL